MLIRMTGNERAALSGTYQHPFLDAPAWEDADAYLGYAYEKGLTKGVAATQFCPNEKADAQMYLTFTLRALGYRDSTDSIVWENWKTLSQKAGLLTDQVDTASFLRGDAVLVSYAALDAAMQGQEGTLADMLLKSGAISDISLATARAIAGKKASTSSSLLEMLGSIYAGADDRLSTAYLQTTQITKENLSFYLGVDQLDFEEGIACEPMMTAQAHSVCLVRVKKGVDVEQVKKDIAAKVNPNKWICVGVEPENIRVENIGNLIILVMDNRAADQMIKNFRALGTTTGLIQTGSTYIDEVSAVDSKSVDRFAKKLLSLRSSYLENNRVFYATVPHKSYYAQTDMDVFLDHAAISRSLKTQLADWEHIELGDALTLADYYRTDAHWRQEKLFGVTQALGKVMGFTVNQADFTVQERKDFVGSYRIMDSTLSPETVQWLTSKAIDGATVKDFQHPQIKTVYQSAALDTNSPYDLFLSGATPLTVIENPNASSDKELIIFRDSFASSLAPLLVGAYAKITLVDLRYMVSSALPQYVDFGSADVLFLFSDQVVNNSLLLK